jgi:hypothetical protein
MNSRAPFSGRRKRLREPTHQPTPSGSMPFPGFTVTVAFPTLLMVLPLVRKIVACLVVSPPQLGR